MYDRLGQSLTGHHVSLGDVFSTGRTMVPSAAKRVTDNVG